MAKRAPKYVPDAHWEREISTAAECDPRTVRKLMMGKPVQGLARRRIERVLAARGVIAPVVPSVAAPVTE